MNSIPALGREAIEHARRGDLHKAIQSGRRAVTAHPRDFGLRVFLAMIHLKRAELDEAVTQLRAAIAINPEDLFPRLELVRVLIGTGQLGEAATLLGQIPLSGREPLRLRAMLLQRSGVIAEAAELYRQLATVDPNDFESWADLGLCLLALNRPQQAIGAFARSIELRPDRMPTRYKWAEAHFAAGSAEMALRDLQALRSQQPNDVAIRLVIAHVHNLLGQNEQALAELEAAVSGDEVNVEALVALAEKLEQLNDLDRFASIVEQLAILPGPVEKLPLLQARLAHRQGNLDEALELARLAPPWVDAGARSQLIGQCLDRLGDARGAFNAFAVMNEEDGRTGSLVAAKAKENREVLREHRRLLTRDWLRSWQSAAPPKREPAFLVGFPRSGTTLLDTLLMGHPAVAVAEEEPMLTTVSKRTGGFPNLGQMDAAAVEKWRQFYFHEAQRYIPEARSGLLIDKNPLAMGSVPIIHRLFPTAKIIFMERHPCDVVLSCFMTRFQPTGLGTNFLTLEDCAALYDEMMQLWTTSAEIFPLRTHVIRYERLVDDAMEELRPLTDFLALEWKPELLDHQSTASKRSFVKTPSYAQIGEPLNRKAVGRWTRYRDQLRPVLPTLEPWVRRMGYDL